MNLISQQINLPESVSLSSDAVTLRDNILASTSELTQVTCAMEQAQVAEFGGHLQKHIKEVRLARLALAEGPNKLCDQLIETEKDYLGPLIAEKDRLGRLVTAYQVAEAHRVAEEKRIRQEAIDRLEKLRFESEAKALRARTENGQLKAEMKAYAADQAQQEVLRAPLPAAVKARGAATRKKLCFLVTDAKAVYAARPELCEITVKPSAIQAVCKAGDVIPGLKLWQEDVTSFRA